MKFFDLIFCIFALNVRPSVAEVIFKISVTKIDCSADETVSTNVSCNLIPARNQVATVNIAFTMLQEQEKVFVSDCNWSIWSAV